MRLDELNYHLPSSQIAQRPLDRRDASRLLSLRCDTGEIGDYVFAQLPALLRGDELLVLNNTRVIPARLFGRRLGAHSQRPSKASRSEHLTGKIEVLLLRRPAPDTWEALVRPGRKLPKGERLLFGEGELEAEILARDEFGLRTLQFVSPSLGSARGSGSRTLCCPSSVRKAPWELRDAGEEDSSGKIGYAKLVRVANISLTAWQLLALVMAQSCPLYPPCARLTSTQH